MTESELAIILRITANNYPIVIALKLQEVVEKETFEKFKKHLLKRLKRHDQLMSWHKENLDDNDLKKEAAKSIKDTLVFLSDVINLGKVIIL